MYKNIFKDKKAAVFDLDGTLADTDPAWKSAFLEVFVAEGGVQVNSYELLQTKGMSDLLKWQEALDRNFLNTQKTAQQLSEEEHKIFLALLKEIDLEVNEGFWELANIFKNDREMKLGLTTNTKKDTALKILEKIKVNVSVFDTALFGDDVKKHKPDPEMYHTTIKKLGIPAKNIIVFEDSPAGASSADKAGLDVVVVWDGVTHQGLYPEKIKLYIQKFSDLVYNLDNDFDEAFRDYREKVLKGRGIDINSIPQIQRQPR